MSIFLSFGFILISFSINLVLRGVKTFNFGYPLRILESLKLNNSSVVKNIWSYWKKCVLSKTSGSTEPCCA